MINVLINNNGVANIAIDSSKSMYEIIMLDGSIIRNTAILFNGVINNTVNIDLPELSMIVSGKVVSGLNDIKNILTELPLNVR